MLRSLEAYNRALAPYAVEDDARVSRGDRGWLMNKVENAIAQHYAVA